MDRHSRAASFEGQAIRKLLSMRRLWLCFRADLCEDLLVEDSCEDLRALVMRRPLDTGDPDVEREVRSRL